MSEVKWFQNGKFNINSINNIIVMLFGMSIIVFKDFKITGLACIVLGLFGEIGLNFIKSRFK